MGNLVVRNLRFDDEQHALIFLVFLMRNLVVRVCDLGLEADEHSPCSNRRACCMSHVCMFACRMSHVACCMLHVACCMLHVACCKFGHLYAVGVKEALDKRVCRMSHVACRVSHVACCMSHVACCMLHVACCMSHLARRMSHVACRMSHAACRMSHVECRMLTVAYCMWHRHAAQRSLNQSGS